MLNSSNNTILATILILSLLGALLGGIVIDSRRGGSSLGKVIA
jgi:hypothetical protein